MFVHPLSYDSLKSPDYGECSEITDVDISEWLNPALEYTTVRHGPMAPLLCGEATIGAMHGNYSKESQIHTMGEMRPARGNSRGHQRRKTNEPGVIPS